jgi:glyoxylase-like metal-dependent hydrolase (beta-lactamase superfamily II)
MSSAGVRRVVPLTFGWEELPQTISIYGGDASVRLREPVPGVLLELDGGWMLLDTGFNVPLVRDPMLCARFHGRDHGIYAELLADPRDSLEVAFEVVGVDPADVVVVALSHLHNDHAGGLRWFAERVPVHMQRRELEYGLHGGRPGDTPEHHGFIRVDYDDPRIDWRLADGEVQLAPGVTAVPTYGHTPGHQSFIVTLEPAAAETYGVPGFVLAFDAADLQRNIDEELAIGGFIDCAPEQTVDAIRRLKAIAADRGYRLVPGHDPEVWPAFTAVLGVPGP